MIEEDKIKKRLAKAPVFRKIKQKRDQVKHREGTREDYPPIHLNEPERNAKKENRFPSNVITTSKYTLWSFIPLVLWSQYRRATTIYFTLIFAITAIPAVSPITPWTGLLGLLFILVVSAVREGWEDVLRHRADKKVNDREYCFVKQSGALKNVKSRDLHVGDFVYVEANEAIPADMVLLLSSNEEGIAYMETSQLDGETNLKQRKVPPVTAGKTKEELTDLSGVLKCEKPNHILYSFKGTLEIEGEDAAPLDKQNLLLQNAYLRNVKWVVGLVAYAGPETKLSLNQREPPFKFSSLDKRLNAYVLVIFLLDLAICVGLSVLSGFFEYKYATHNYYLTTDPSGYWMVALKRFASYFALLSFLIPLSLVVSLEVVKVIQSRFMEWDKELSTKDGRMTARTSTLTDELALAKYVFCDKTGTLTENVMKFKQCSIRGRLYEDAEEDHLQRALEDADKEEAGDVENFLRCMALCHSAIPDSKEQREREEAANDAKADGDKNADKDEAALRAKNGDKGKDKNEDEDKTNKKQEKEKEKSEKEKKLKRIRKMKMKKKRSKRDREEDEHDARDRDEDEEEEEDEDAIDYKASSPDEEALCRAARDNGFAFVKRAPQALTVEENDEEVEYELLCSMEFTSDRKRMSVIVKLPDGKLKLYSKGADSVMLERLKEGEDDDVRRKTKKQLHELAKSGLRTLILAEKELSQEECDKFLEQYKEASNKIDDREEAVEEVCDEMERDLVLIGATGIEDKLQKGVPEAIQYLLDAGMKVWVITGDKQETAINIAYSSRLLRSDMKLLKLNAESSDECLELLKKYLEENKDAKQRDRDASGDEDDAKERNEGKELACIIDGHTLKYALKDHPDEFVELTGRCHSVICCRTTPLQKGVIAWNAQAKVVKLMREATDDVTVAIGDGANDVSMIHAAHVGVGIFGKEGTQAARASDFAIRTFRHITRLLCVHGRYSMIRNSLLIHYAFYKNAAVFLVLVWLAFFSGFSAQTIYDDWLMAFFNILITSLPPLAIATFEQDIPEKAIKEHPEAYERVQNHTVFTYKTLSLWFLSATYHSLVLFFGAYLLWDDGVLDLYGRTLGFWDLGNMILIVGIVVISLKLVLHVNHWNWIVHVSVWGSFLVYLGLSSAVNVIYSFYPLFAAQYFAFFQLALLPATYAWIGIGVVVCLLPDLLTVFVKRMYYPEEWQILQERYGRDDSARKGWKKYGVFADEETVPLSLSESARSISDHQWV